MLVGTCECAAVRGYCRALKTVATRWVPDAPIALRQMIAAIVWAVAATGAVAADDRFQFDIPSQSVETALAAYVTVTGVETIYDSALIGRRQSTAVKGMLKPDIALRILLEGSGLSEISTGNAFAVVAAPRTERYGGARLADYSSYYSALQNGIAQVFCRHPETVPGGFRAVIRFSVGGAGEVHNLKLLNSTGELRRDSIITDELRRAVFDVPPATMPQPITMIVAPRAAARTGDCDIGIGGQSLGGQSLPPRMVQP